MNKSIKYKQWICCGISWIIYILYIFISKYDQCTLGNYLGAVAPAKVHNHVFMNEIFYFMSSFHDLLYVNALMHA
jgi:hypothetical protein